MLVCHPSIYIASTGWKHNKSFNKETFIQIIAASVFLDKFAFWKDSNIKPKGIGNTINTAKILIYYVVEYAPLIDHVRQLNH